MLLPARKFPFWLTQNKFQWFLKVKSKKRKSKKKKKKKKKKRKRKRSSPHFVTFPHSFSNFPPPLFRFSFFFAPFFPFFLVSLLTVGQQNFPGQKSRKGALCLSGPTPSLLHHCVWKIFWSALPPVATVCQELTKCGCTTQCRGRCRGYKYGLPCTCTCTPQWSCSYQD